MSIVMNLYYTGEGGAARRFVEEMERSGTADLIRAEEGNQRYAYFYPADDPETVLLIDIWRDQRAIDLHHASPMVAGQALVPAQLLLHLDLGGDARVVHAGHPEGLIA